MKICIMNLPISFLMQLWVHQLKYHQLMVNPKLKYPQGTQHGKQFRLRGKGMPILRRSTFGDLIYQSSNSSANITI